jgi:hypothetical protein
MRAWSLVRQDVESFGPICFGKSSMLLQVEECFASLHIFGPDKVPRYKWYARSMCNVLFSSAVPFVEDMAASEGVECVSTRTIARSNSCPSGFYENEDSDFPLL